MPHTTPPPPPLKSTAPISLHLTTFARLRAYFITGLVVTAPIAITLWVMWWFVTWVDDLVKPWLPSASNPDNYLPMAIPGFGLIIAVFGLVVIGFLAANFFGRAIIRFWDRVLDRMPVARNIYKTLKQIFETAASPGGFSFHKVGLIEFPREGLWSIVFIARNLSRDGEIVQKTSGEDMVAVYVPTTPNPTSGYLCYVRTSELVMLDMSVEDGIKAIVSAGLVGSDPRSAARPVIGLDAKAKDKLLAELTPPRAAAPPRRARRGRAGSARHPHAATGGPDLP
jgi:uncharacterized membrane protein